MNAPRRLLLINPNTTTEVTALMGRHLEDRLPAGWEIQSRTAAFGAPYISCEASHAIAAHAVLKAWCEETSVPAAVLIGCFGDPGLFALRESCPAPVTGLAEASFMEASRLGPFAIVTGGARWKPMLERLAQALGYADQLVHIETVTPTGAQLRADPQMARECLHQACAQAITAGAQAVIVGGAGLAGMAQALQAECSVPLIDSVEAGWRVLSGGAAPASPADAASRTEVVRSFLG